MQAAEDAESIYSESLEEDSEGEDIEAPILSAAAFSSEFETKFMQWIDDYALLDELSDMIALPSGGSAGGKEGSSKKDEQHLATAQEATESLEKRDTGHFEGVEETARHSRITGVKRSHDQLVTEDESEACVAVCADGSDVRLVVNRDHVGQIVIFPERLLVHHHQFEKAKRKMQSDFGDTPRFMHRVVQCIDQLEHRCTYELDRALQHRFGMKECFSKQLVAACVEASSAGAQWTVAWDTKQGVRAAAAPTLGNHVLVQQVQDLYPIDTMLAQRCDCRETEQRVKTVQEIVEQHPELTCLLTSHVASATQPLMKKSKACVEREEVEESAPMTQQFSSESVVAVVEEGDLFVALEDAADSEEDEPAAEPSGDQVASTPACDTAETRSVRRLTVIPRVHHPVASTQQHLSADWTEACIKDKGVKRGHTLACNVRDECISVCASWAWKKYQLPEQVDLLLEELVDIGTFAPVAVEDDGRMTFLFADLVLVLLVFGVIAKADEPSVMTVMANVPEWRAFDTQKSDARLRVRKTLLQKHAGLTEYGCASVNNVSGKQLRVVYYEPPSA